jgi:hypothetical protein
MKPSLLLTLGALALTLSTLAQAQILFSGSYSNNFDGMRTNGVTYDSGWSAVRLSDGAAITLAVSSGTSSAGGMYNVGSLGDADRALGSLASATTIPRFGAQLQNLTGALVTQLTLSGVMEQWRTGSSAATDENLTFEYSLNASGINDATATWVAAPGMDLHERLTTSTTAGAVNGNLPANQLQLSASLGGLNWGDGSVLTLRWTDQDHAGSDGLYALDNFSARTVPEPSTWALLAMGALACLGRRLRR